MKTKPLNHNENSVLHEFAKRLNITPMQIIEQNKRPYICDIRHLYCKLRHEKHGRSFSETGREIGRTHTAARSGVQRINVLLRLNDKRTMKMWNRVRDIKELYIGVSSQLSDEFILNN